MTFHPGKVLSKISPSDKLVKSSDESTQASVEMWDGNLFTFIISDEIVDDVEKGSIVLVDYRPRKGHKMPVATQEIIKVLEGDLAKEVWENYKKFQDSRSSGSQTTPMQQPSYMG